MKVSDTLINGESGSQYTQLINKEIDFKSAEPVVDQAVIDKIQELSAKFLKLTEENTKLDK